MIKNNLNFNNALILGSGGASKAIQYALNIKKINFDIASRQKNIKYIIEKFTTKTYHLKLVKNVYLYR